MKIEIVGNISETEAKAYVQQIKDRHPNDEITEIKLTENGEYIDADYEYNSIPFQRIRRITGYLTGGLDRFNDAKYAEVCDRVKHGVS